MNYYGRYGLEWNPFIKNVKKDVIVETSEYKEATYRLNYLLDTKGFGLITGEPGRGKTTMIRNWSKQLNESLYKIVYLSLSTITVMEFYRQLATGLGIEPGFRKVDNFRLIQEAINHYALEKRITPVIILDEANYMKASILNDLKLLFNFAMDSRDRAIVLLVGLPNIITTLRLVSHEPLRQRIIMNYHLETLTKEEAKTYIKEVLKQAGAYQEVFSTNALEAISNSSNGNPRMINKLCNTCLFIGDNLNVEVINEDIVMKAANEMELG